MAEVTLSPGLYKTANGSIAKVMKVVQLDRQWYWRGAATDETYAFFRVWFLSLWDLRGKNVLYPSLNLETRI